jgi:hypothetical protein
MRDSVTTAKAWCVLHDEKTLSLLGLDETLFGVPGWD